MTPDFFTGYFAGIVTLGAFIVGLIMWKSRGSTLALGGLRVVDRDESEREAIAQLRADYVAVLGERDEARKVKPRDFYDESREP